MGKKHRRHVKIPTTTEMKDVCLHCAFFEAHKHKWPQWTPSSEDEHQDAFNDLVRSAAKVVAEVFTMLSPMDQMQFMHRVMEQYKRMIGVTAAPHSLAEIVELFRRENGPTKH